MGCDIAVPRRLGDNRSTLGIDGMNEEDMLGQIEANGCDSRQIG